MRGPLSPPPSLPPPLSPPPLGAGRRLQTAGCGSEIVTHSLIITRVYSYSEGPEFAQPVADTSLLAVRQVTSSDCVDVKEIVSAANLAISAQLGQPLERRHKNTGGDAWEAEIAHARAHTHTHTLAMCTQVTVVIDID